MVEKRYGLQLQCSSWLALVV